MRYTKKDVEDVCKRLDKAATLNFHMFEKTSALTKLFTDAKLVIEDLMKDVDYFNARDDFAVNVMRGNKQSKRRVK